MMPGFASPSAERFARLVRPRSIALIGGREAARVAEQCDRMGFEGALWPVHPKRATVAGRPACPSVAELPGVPDAAFVAVNRHASIEVVAALARAGAGGAVCYASGFLESDNGGALQRALVEAAAEMPIVGPNCYGLVNFLDGVPLWPDQHGGRRLGPDERGVAIITQSSNIGVSLTMQQRGLPVAYLVTAGNQAQLGISDLASALLDDERVSAAGLYVEGFDSVAGFEALASKARERAVPVVVMKTGRSERARASNLTHTASIAGSDAGAEAFLRRLGFARVHGIPELVEALKLLHVHGALGGVRISAMCCSGGETAVLSDTIEDTRLAFPHLAPEHAASVRATVHPLVTVANPFDYHTFGWGDEAALAETFTAFARGGFDATMLVLDFPRTDRCDDADWEAAVSAFDRAASTTGATGVIAATLAENLPEERAVRLIERGIAPLAGVREAFTAIECAATIGEAWRSPPGAPLLVDDHARLPAGPMPMVRASPAIDDHACIPSEPMAIGAPAGIDDPGRAAVEPARPGASPLIEDRECVPAEPAQPGAPAGIDDPGHAAVEPARPGASPLIDDHECVPAEPVQPGAPPFIDDHECFLAEPILLDEAASKAWLAEFGVEAPEGAIARGEDEAVTIAASLDGPVAVKALGIAHKTERGAVRLGLSEPGEVRAAVRELPALGDRVLVERFETGVVAELVVGLHRDPQLGLLLTVGSGGIFVELAADTVTMLLPVVESEVRGALSRLRCAPMLAGWRGREPADTDAAVAAILGIVKFAVANQDRIEELDVNPLGVRARGRGALALDALIRTRETRT